MNTPSKKKQEKRSDSDAPIFEPFPEPQTMPKGWDFSELIPAENLPAAEPAGDKAEA